MAQACTTAHLAHVYVLCSTAAGEPRAPSGGLVRIKEMAAMRASYFAFFHLLRGGIAERNNNKRNAGTGSYFWRKASRGHRRLHAVECGRDRGVVLYSWLRGFLLSEVTWELGSCILVHLVH